MNPTEALSLAILALNTLADPSATTPGDLDVLDGRTDEALDALAALRGALAEASQQDVRAAFTRDDAGWTHPDHLDHITVSTFYGERDGVPVVQVDSGGAPRVRINLNDGAVWDGLPAADALPGRFFAA